MAIREKITIDSREYRQDLHKVEDTAERTARNTEQAWGRSSREMRQDAKRTTNEMEGGFKRIGTAAKLWIASIATTAFYTLRKALIRSQEIEETASKFETVLGPSIGKANEFIKENARLMGLSRTEAQEMIATTTAIAQGMNFTGSEAADFGFDIVKLAGDLQSFNDVPIERTHNAITTALTGEREALKSLGIVIRETEVQERALANTGKDAADALTQQEKATATLELITKKAGVAVGDLERTATSSANRTRQSMANIQTLLDTLSSKLNQSFGPQLITWLENALGIAEDLVSTIDRSMSSGMENLIRNLEAQGGNQELVARLKKQQAINEAIELRKELKKELDELEIAVGIDEKGMSDRINDTMSALKGTMFANPLNDFFGEDGGFMDTFNKVTKSFQEDFKTVNESFDPAKIDEYNERISEMQEQLRAVSEQALKAEEMGFHEEAEALSNMSNTLADAITSMSMAVGKQEQLNNVNKSLVELQNQSTTAMQAQNEEAEEQARKFGEVAFGFNKIERAWKQLGQNLDIGAGSIMKTHFDALINGAENYEATLRRLDNELAMNQISQEKYNQEVEKATAKYLQQLQSTYEMFKSKLGPEQQKVFEALIKNLKKTEKEGDKAKASLGDIAESLNSVLSLADAFGDVDENLKNVLRGSIDLLRNLEAINKLDGSGFMGLGGTGLSGAIGAIGVAAGVVTMLSGFIGQNSQDNEERLRQMEEMQDLRVSLNSLRRAVIKQTNAYLDQGVVGGDVTQEEIERGETLFEGFFTGDKDRGGEPFGYAGEETFLTNLAELAELFPEVFGQFEDMYQNYRDQGMSHSQAVAQLMQEGLGEAWSLIEDSFRQYGESIEGAQQVYEDAIKFGAKSTQEAFDLFIQQVEAAGLDLSQSVGGKTLAEWMQELNDPETTQAEREAIIQMIWENWEDLIPSGWSYDDFTSWLETISSHDPSTESGAEQGFSRSVQFNRTITDVQANEVIVLLEWIGEAVWRMVEMAGGDRMNLGSVGSNGIGGLNIELPLPVRVENWDEMMSLVYPEGSSSGSGNVSITRLAGGDDRPHQSFNIGVQVESPGASVSDEAIDELTRRIGNELRRELRGKAF
ncbi:MAG: hypothetical protein HUJ22_08795 [Gracilimonas sp.]|uniref:hypothetical protein n=1 Tax=Gracilimonas sp. TaxID=1974203 RepID=UPI0019C9B97A|nr:hypothetical protein [Gracilimonas sp.]MBD3616658.1 hypothetical protein [Gracilimonas sp.]